MPEVCNNLKGHKVEEINQLLELFEEKLEICKIDTPKRIPKNKIDRINIKKTCWINFIDYINLKLQVYYMKSEGKKPGKKTKKKKKELFEKIKNDQNVLESAIIIRDKNNDVLSDYISKINLKLPKDKKSTKNTTEKCEKNTFNNKLNLEKKVSQRIKLRKKQQELQNNKNVLKIDQQINNINECLTFQQRKIFKYPLIKIMKIYYQNILETKGNYNYLDYQKRFNKFLSKNKILPFLNSKQNQMEEEKEDISQLIDLDLPIEKKQIPTTQCENQLEIQILLNQDCNIFLVNHRLTKFQNIIALAQTILKHFLVNKDLSNQIPDILSQNKMFCNYNNSLIFVPSIYLVQKNIRSLLIKLFLICRQFCDTLITNLNEKLTLFEMLLDHYQIIELDKKQVKKDQTEFKQQIRNLSFSYFVKDIKNQPNYGQLTSQQVLIYRIRILHAQSIFFSLQDYQCFENEKRQLQLLIESFEQLKQNVPNYNKTNLINLFWMKQKRITQNFYKKTMDKMESNKLKIQIMNIEINKDDDQITIKQKLEKIFNIFENSLNNSFDEAIHIYYRKIVMILRNCPNHKIFFEYLSKIFQLFHELIFKKPQFEDYKKLITLIYQQLSIKQLLKMIINRLQKQNLVNIYIDNEGILFMKMISVIIFKIIFLSISLIDILDQHYLLLCFISLSTYVVNNSSKRQHKSFFNAFLFSFVYKVQKQMNPEQAKDIKKKLTQNQFINSHLNDAFEVMQILADKVEVGVKKKQNIDIIEVYQQEQINEMEEGLDILERDTLIYFRDIMGLNFPPEFSELKQTTNDQICAQKLKEFKVTNPNEIIQLLYYIKYFYPLILRIDSILPEGIIKYLEKISKYMKANEVYWFQEQTMGDKKRKSLKNFAKGNIRFSALSEQLKIFKLPPKPVHTSKPIFPPKETLENKIEFPKMDEEKILLKDLQIPGQNIEGIQTNQLLLKPEPNQLQQVKPNENLSYLNKFPSDPSQKIKIKEEKRIVNIEQKIALQKGKKLKVEETLEKQKQIQNYTEYNHPIFQKYIFYFLGRAWSENFFNADQRYETNFKKLLTKAEQMLKVNLMVNSRSLGAWFIYGKCLFDLSLHYSTQALYIKEKGDFPKFTNYLGKTIRTLMYAFDLLQLQILRDKEQNSQNLLELQQNKQYFLHKDLEKIDYYFLVYQLPKKNKIRQYELWRIQILEYLMLTFIFWDGFKEYCITVLDKSKKQLDFMKKLQSLFNSVKTKIFKINIQQKETKVSLRLQLLKEKYIFKMASKVRTFSDQKMVLNQAYDIYKDQSKKYNPGNSQPQLDYEAEFYLEIWNTIKFYLTLLMNFKKAQVEDRVKHISTMKSLANFISYLKYVQQLNHEFSISPLLTLSLMNEQIPSYFNCYFPDKCLQVSKSYSKQIMNRVKSDEITVINQENMEKKIQEMDRNVHIVLNVLKEKLQNLFQKNKKYREKKFYYKSILILTEMFCWVFNKQTKGYHCMCNLISKSNDFEIYRCEKDLLMSLFFNCDMKFIMTKYQLQKFFFEICETINKFDVALRIVKKLGNFVLKEKDIKTKPFWCLSKSFLIGFQVIVRVIVKLLKRFQNKNTLPKLSQLNNLLGVNVKILLTLQHLMRKSIKKKLFKKQDKMVDNLQQNLYYIGVFLSYCHDKEFNPNFYLKTELHQSIMQDIEDKDMLKQTYAYVIGEFKNPKQYGKFFGNNLNNNEIIILEDSQQDNLIKLVAEKKPLIKEEIRDKSPDIIMLDSQLSMQQQCFHNIKKKAQKPTNFNDIIEKPQQPINKNTEKIQKSMNLFYDIIERPQKETSNDIMQNIIENQFYPNDIIEKPKLTKTIIEKKNQLNDIIEKSVNPKDQ